jgi:CO dehydrogenase maturation factor
MFLVISRAADASDISFLDEEIEKTGLKLAGVIPFDPLVMEYDLKGKPLVQLPRNPWLSRRWKRL